MPLYNNISIVITAILKCISQI